MEGGGGVLVVVLAGAFCLVAELLVGGTQERFLVFACQKGCADHLGALGFALATRRIAWAC